MSSFWQKITRDTKETRKYGSFKEKKKPREAVPEKDLKVDPLADDFKITALKILRELKENRESQEKDVQTNWKYQ